MLSPTPVLLRRALPLSLAVLTACSGQAGRNLFLAIYGNDDRREAALVTDPATVSRARATVGILPRSLLQPQADGSYTYRTRHSTPGARPFCEGERFADQPQLPGCTGVLVGPDLILTAGHCVDLAPLCNPQHDCAASQNVCPLLAFAFDWAVDPTTGQVPERFQENQIAFCSQVIAGERDPVRHIDWALIRTDRFITDRTPAPLAGPTEIPTEGTPVVQISHVMGWPLKVLGGAEIMRVDDEHTLSSNTDTYNGSSGGPLFNARTGRLIGILEGGARDFDIDHSQVTSCNRSHQCAALNPCRGETYQRVDTIAAEIARAMQPDESKY